MTMRQYRQQSKLKNNFLLQTSPYIFIPASNHIYTDAAVAVAVTIW